MLVFIFYILLRITPKCKINITNVIIITDFNKTMIRHDDADTLICTNNINYKSVFN